MAENKEHINITMIYQGTPDKSVDLRIPANITVYRLIREVNQIFNKPDSLAKYQIKVINKGILLDEEQRIKNFPVTDGDIIEVLEDPINANDN